MIVVIAGSRDITDPKILEDAIKQSGFEITEIISGGARGIDTLARYYAKWASLPFHEIRPAWEKLGKRAGFERNKQMVELGDAVIAVWDGESKGTKHTIDYAHSQGKAVFVRQVSVKELFDENGDFVRYEYTWVKDTLYPALEEGEIPF